MEFAAARQSACRGPGPGHACACVEPCGNLNAVSLNTYVNVIANMCVPAYKYILIHINNT